MARTVSVEMELDDEGVVQEVKAQGVAFEQAADAADDYSESMERQEAAARESTQASEQSANADREQAQASEVAAQANREQAASQERVAASSTTMTSNVSSSANALGFELVQGAQDAKFGLAGVANQIPLMTEQFSRLQSKTGSTTGAMGALFSALKGPAGIIGAFTLLLTFKDEIVGFFESVGVEAETAAAGIEEVKGQLEETLDLGDLGELGTDTDAIQEEVGRLEEGLQKLKEERSRLAEESETAVERAALSAQASLAEFLRSQGMSAEFVEQLGAAEGEAAEQASDAATRQDELDAAINQVNTRLKVLRGRLRAIDAVGEVAPDLLKDEGGDAAEDNLDSINEILQETIRAMSELPDGQLVSEEMPDLRQELNLPALATDLQDVQDLLDAGMLNSIGAVNAALGSLDTMLANATSQEKRNRIRALIQELEGLRSEMQRAGKEGDQLFQNMEQVVSGALTSGFRELGRAIGEGQSAMEALGQAAASVLSQIAQAIGKQLIAQGTALVASGNVGQGSAYIAAGGTILASAGALQSIGGGGSGGTGGTSARGDQIQTGGQASTEVDVPGRRSGGPVQGGRLYETHGLGQREFFMPATDGAIVTEGAMRAATASGRSRQRVDVRTDNNLNIDVDDPDLFDLRARLNEVENEITQLR